MAPITAASAKLAYEKAANQLLRACNSLERYLPAPEPSDAIPDAPSLAPRQRTVSTRDACALCVSDLLDLEPEDREQHVCTHQDQRGERREDDVASVTGSDIGPPSAQHAWAEQANTRDGWR